MTPVDIFTAIAAAIKAIPIIDSWFQKIVAAWMNGQQKQTMTQIIDAAAFAARADTDELRYQASEKWRKALSRPRVSA
jgi:hypothetical protein